MSAKIIGIIVAVVIIIVIIVVVINRKSFFSKKSSENETVNDSDEEEEVEKSSYEEESEYDENVFQEENVTSGNGSSYEVDEQVQEEDEQEEEDDDFLEDVDFETEIEDVEYQTEMEGLTPINSETSSEVMEEPIIMEVTEQECADAGGTNYYKCPETGVTYCCGLCDNSNMVTCPSSNGCRDRRGDVDEETGKSEECQTHKNNGGCSSANSNHFNWRSECVKTCGYCDDERYNVPGRCACIGELTKENSDLVGYALKYSELYREFEFDENKLWNHWNSDGKNEKRIMNPLLPMDDLYNQEGFPAYPMPTNPAWGKLKNDDGNVIFTDGWIWHLPMPSITEIPDGQEGMMMTVPIDTCKFYRDYNNTLGMDHPVKLYVNVDDFAYLLHNNKFIKKIIGQNNPGIDLTLVPGKNRIMLVAGNNGGPAGLQAAMLDDVNDSPLISTAVQSSWRYINDIYHHRENHTLSAHGNHGNMAKLKCDGEDWDGKHTFWYCYNNTSGTVINGKIISRFDDYGVIWHERKLLLAKSMNDPEPCFVKIRPGKNVFIFSVSNYGGPGWVAAQCINISNNQELWRTQTNGMWHYKKTNHYPGPAEDYTVYEHGTYNSNGTRSGYIKSFRYGVWDRARMENRGVGRNSMSSAKVPRGMQVTNFNDPNFPNGANQTLHANRNYTGFTYFNDRIDAFVIQTPQYNRALFFDQTWARNQFRFSNSYVTNNVGLTSGTYNRSAMENKKVMNDDVDDIIYPKGMKVTIYEHDNKTGASKTFGPKGDIQTQEGVGLTNKNTSIVVETSSSWGYTDYQVFNDNLLGAGNVEKFLSQ